MDARVNTSILTAKRADMSFCPGCSHGMVLEQIAAAIQRMGLTAEQVCLVSDIGCVGIADRYFTSHTFHGLHGRSVTYAEGIKRICPDLMVIVLIGDGGCGIGTGHLVHAARRGVGVKVIVCNNFNFGMTGGQQSPTTPECAYTTTTPRGASDYPLNICGTVAANGAAHVARYSAFDPKAVDYMEAALRAPGFALLDLWELCTAYYVPANKLTRPGLVEMSEQLNLPFGLLQHRSADGGLLGSKDSPERSTETLSPVQRAEQATGAPPRLRWSMRTEICIAGSAGQHIRSAAGVIGRIAVAGGLHAAQYDDFPITVRKGHSVSNLIIADEPILYTGVDSPQLVILLSDEGAQRLGGLRHLNDTCLIIADEGIDLAETDAGVRRINLRLIEKEAGKALAALAVLTYGLIERGWVNAAPLLDTATTGITGKYRDQNLQAMRFGANLASPTQPKTEQRDSTPRGGP